MAEEKATEAELIQSSYYYAANSMRDGMPTHLIVDKLVERGLSPDVAKQVIQDLQQAVVNEHKRAGRRTMLYGALWCGGGILVTAISYAAAEGGGKFLVVWGAIVFGAVQLVRGAIHYSAASK